MQQEAISPGQSLPAPIRVLLVDDEDIVRYGLKMICQAEPSIEVVGEANNGQMAIAQAQALKPDVVLMDVSMPVMDGVTATGRLRQALPDTKVLILTVHESGQHLIDAMQQGAAGYFLKNTPPEDFADIIRATHKGYWQLAPSLGQKLCQQLQTAPPAQPNNADQPVRVSLHPRASRATGQRDQADRFHQKGITRREQEVLALIAEGASNREIAHSLHIAEKTVKNHVSSLLSRVGLRDRTQLALWHTQVGA